MHQENNQIENEWSNIEWQANQLIAPNLDPKRERINAYHHAITCELKRSLTGADREKRRSNAMQRLTVICEQLANAEETEALLHMVIETMRTFFGASSRETLWAVCMLAEAHHKQGRYEEAIILLEMVMEHRQRAAGCTNGHFQTLLQSYCHLIEPVKKARARDYFSRPAH